MSTVTAVKPSLTIKRRFNAPPEKVYSAWTVAEKMKGWMGPGKVFLAQAESDTHASAGDTVSSCMTRPAARISTSAEYFAEVIPNEKLVYTWHATLTPEDYTLITVTLKRHGTGTLLTLIHEPFPDDAIRDSHNQGWNGAMDKLDKYLTA